MGSDRIPVSKWREWDEMAAAGRAFIARRGRDITLACRDAADNNTPDTPRDSCKSQRDKKTICLDTGEVFDSATAAGVPLGGTSSQIVAVCRGVLKSYKGHRFAYYDDYIAGTIPEYKGQKRKTGERR